MKAIILFLLLALAQATTICARVDADMRSQTPLDADMHTAGHMDDPQEATSLVKLTEKNFITIRGEINGANSAKVINQLLKYQPGSEVYIYLNTNGGSVISGMEIVRAIKSLADNKVSVKCIADTALSMGFVIFQYCPVRYVTLSSVLMQHQMNIGMHGPINQVDNYLRFIKSVETEIDSHQAKRIGIPLESFHANTGHDWWLWGSSAVTANVADKTVNVLCDFETKYVNETFRVPLWGDVTVTYSNCPLARDAVRVSFGRNDLPQDIENEIQNKFDMTAQINERLSHSDHRIVLEPMELV